MKKTEKIFLKDLYYECESSGDPMTTRLIIYPNGDLEAQHFYDGDGPEHAEISHSNGGFNQRETDLFLAEGVNPDESQAARRAFFSSRMTRSAWDNMTFCARLQRRQTWRTFAMGCVWLLS